MSVKSDMMEIIDQATTQKTSAYDSTAEVTRVEGDTIWVHLAGGVTETPVRKTISARPGDTVQVRVSGGRAWIQGNETNPPTDDTAANKAAADAVRANAAAQSAVQSATTASVAAADAQEKATTASAAAATALTKAQEAEDSAEQAATAAATADQKATAAGTAAAAAQTSADQAASAAATADSKATAASSAASRAESSASAASTAASQAVTDAAAAQTAANNAGQAASRAQAAADAAQGDIDDQQEYFWHDALGAHVLSDTDEVSGLRYRTDLKGAGQEIFEIDGQTEKSVAKFGADGARLGETGGAHSVIDADGQRFYASDGATQLANIGYGEGASGSGTAVAPYYTFGKRISGSVVGNFSVAEGSSVTASGEKSHAEGSSTSATAQAAHAEGIGTTSSGFNSHAEGYYSVASADDAHAEGDHTTASAFGAHAEGGQTVASGQLSHAQNNSTIAAKDNQTAIGKFNIEDTETTTAKQKAFIIGNGTNYTRSNAFTVDWEGNTEATGDITDGSGNKLSDRASTTQYGMTQLVNSYSSTATDKAATPYAVKQAYDKAQNALDAIPEIDSGRTASITAAANNYKDLSVSFGRTFSSVPQVVCSIYSTSTAGAIGSLTCSALDVTKTGFKVRVFNAGSASRSPAVDWIAVN